MYKANREYVIELFRRYGLGKDACKQVYQHWDEFVDLGIVNNFANIDSWKTNVRYLRLQLIKTSFFNEEEMGQDVIDHNISLMRKNQKLADKNRIANKEFRENARHLNVLEELNKELVSLLKENSLKDFTVKHRENKKNKTVVVGHISDTHFNELVQPTSSLHNIFDFDIASQRLKKLADEYIRQLKAYNTKNLVLTLTGDLINNDKLADKKLSQATNRTKATLLSVFLLEQFIVYLNKYANITIASVTGNESRVNEDYNSIEYLVSDSYDVMIDQILRVVFKDSKGITFLDGSYTEKVVNIGNVNILLVHGDRLKHSNLEKEVHSKIAKYANLGLTIHFVICGHLHSAYISSFFARAGSLVGGNAYSDETLNLISKASQNIYIINSENKDIHSIAVDLQNTDDYKHDKFDIKKSLEAYNAKSASKNKKDITIYKVVI